MLDCQKNIDQKTSNYCTLQALTALLILVLTIVNVIFYLPHAVFSQEISSVTITPEIKDIQAVIDQKPEGTSFIFQPGVYRNQTIIPKNNDVFIAKPGVILNGARELIDFVKEGKYWVISYQQQPGQISGQCRPERPVCKYPEDLFFNNKLLERVLNLEELASGKWFFDYRDSKVYLADDPSGYRIEIGATRHAFTGSANNVHIRGFIVEKYAVPAQFGAIDAKLGRNWIIENNEIRFNHGAGVVAGNGTQVKNNYTHHNGEVGIGGIGDDIVIEGNETSFNNIAGYAPGWSAGGAKFAKTQNLIVRNNYVHHNYGRGLWTDVDSIYTLYEGNLIEWNNNSGIQHEISYDATIQNNIVRFNGMEFDDWMWGSQILIQNSQNVQVKENTIIVAKTGGDGIGIIHQNRGEGDYGPYIAVNNNIHNNKIIFLGTVGTMGLAANCTNCSPPFDPETAYLGNNVFDYNQYFVAEPDGSYWGFRKRDDWVSFQEQGQELHGSLASLVQYKDCLLSEAFWAQSETSQNQPIGLILRGINCDKKDVVFQIFSEDNILQNKNPIAQLAPVRFIGIQASAIWQPKNLGSYSFLAYIKENKNNYFPTSDQKLIINPLSSTCGNGIVEDGEECDSLSKNCNDQCLLKMDLSSGLQNLWGFDEDNLDNLEQVRDEISNIHGTARNGVAREDGIVKKAGYFDGVDDYVFIPPDKSLNLGTEYSLSFWIKPQSVDKTMSVYRLLQQTDSSLLIQNNGFIHATAYNSGSSDWPMYDIWSKTAINPNYWTHITFTVSNNELSLYINGILDNKEKISAIKNSSNNFGMFIGKFRDSFPLSFSGLIDEMVVWKRALTAKEIFELYLSYHAFSNCKFYSSECASSIINLSEIINWRESWATQDSQGDVNGDGVVNLEDYLAVLREWLSP